MRLAEFGIVHRRELSGVLAGLLRVVRITQDDAHIFCTKEQLSQEVESLLQFVHIVYSDIFNFTYSLELSTKPEKFMGDVKDWNYAEKLLEAALKKSKKKYQVKKGEGAFYGPKIDVHIEDSLKRKWQCATIQLDMQMPKRFDITYFREDGKEVTPFVIHRTIIGSLERFIGVLLEHLNGNLPLWLSPRQVRILNFTDRNTKACQKFVAELKEKIPSLRIEEDYRAETVQAKIRDAAMSKTNFIILIGDKEEKSNVLAVRTRDGKVRYNVKKEEFIKQFKELIFFKKFR